MKTYNISFPILNQSYFPIDHGYSLFSCLSKICPTLHANKNLAVLPISGNPFGLQLQSHQDSKVTIRISNLSNVEEINPLLSLAYQKMNFYNGTKLYFGAPEISQPESAEALYSRLVIYNRITKEEDFLNRVQQDLKAKNIIASIRLGKSRSILIHDKKIYGYSVLIQDLKSEDSLLLQAVGLGSKQRCGCGSFCPVKQ